MHPGACTHALQTVHPVYMIKKRGTKPALRWRPNCIRFWREYRGFTLEEAAEALSRPPHDLNYTHTSLGRAENAKQMPKIEMIEALAKLYGTDVDSLINRRPEASPIESARGIIELWDAASTDERGVILEVARRVVKTAAK